MRSSNIIGSIKRTLSGDHPLAGAKNTDKIAKLLANVDSLNYTGILDHYRNSENLFLRGAFCDFYRCTLPPHPSLVGEASEIHESKVVIVKRRQMPDYHRDELPGCCEELLIWSSLKHENVLSLLGFILDGPNHCPSLIADWSPNGTVSSYLAMHPQTDLVQMSHGIANALAYMHSKGIIHGNVKTANILVSSVGRPLLSGFTLSVWPDLHRRVYEGRRRGLKVQDTDEFPETWGSATKDADVWAFGMTVMRMIKRVMQEKPDGNKLQAVSDILHGSEDLDMDLSKNHEYEELWFVCQACWHPDTESQPTMDIILQAFDEMNLRSLEKLAVESRLRRTLLGYRQADLTGKIIQLEEFNRNHGGFSDVYFGRSTVHDKLVAIKRVRYRLHDDLQFIKRMVRELQIWSRLYHKNVLRLLGYSVDGGLYYLSLITEWMDNGTVLQYMRTKGETVDLLHMVQGIAAGLEYLHMKNIVHSDMKSGNVLISPEGEPLVTDFGISHMLSSSTVASLTTGTYGTVRWMAYEQINVDEAQSSTPYTFQTDVWAFGMTVLELLTLELPYAHLLMDQQVTIAIYKGERPRKPLAYDVEWNAERRLLWDVCESCWNLDPIARPTLKAVTMRLDAIRDFRSSNSVSL